MLFNGWNHHPECEGKHAFLGASQHAWLRYNDEILAIRYFSKFQPEIGTAVHELAKDLIDNKIRLNEHSKNLIELHLSRYGFPRESYDADGILRNLMPFVNDAIGFHMKSEVVLKYSPDCFGTTDAICVETTKKILRISDYKNGENPVSMEQPLIYAAYFYLEYPQFNPKDYTTILRIYQLGEIQEYIPTPDEIIKVMDIAKEKNEKITVLKGAKI